MLLLIFIGIIAELAFYGELTPSELVKTFLLIEFNCTFSVSCKIIPYYVYKYCILFR